MTLQSAYFMSPVVRLIKQALRSGSRIGANVLSATAGAFVHVIAKCDHHSGNIRSPALLDDRSLEDIGARPCFRKSDRPCGAPSTDWPVHDSALCGCRECR